MQKTTISLHLTSLVLTPFNHKISSLTLTLTNHQQQILLEKETSINSINGEGMVPLGLKISFTPPQTQIFLRISSKSMEQIHPFPVDLDLLASTTSQSYRISNHLIVRLNIEHPNGSPVLPHTYTASESSNEYFIRQRQSFLARFKQNHGRQQRSMLRTPQFHRQSPSKEQCELRGRIEELLAKTRELKNNQNRQKEGNLIRKSQPHQLSHRKYHRSMTPFQYFQEQSIEEHSKAIIPQNYYNKGIQQYSLPYKLLQNVICRTNDSYSISSQQEQPIISPNQLFNAKLPLRKPAQ